MRPMPSVVLWVFAAISLCTGVQAQTVKGSSMDLRGPGSQIKVRNSNSNVGGYIFSNADHNILVMGGVEWNGTDFIARATSASILRLGQGGVTFYGNTGLTPGVAYAPTQLSTSVGFQYDVRTYGALCDGSTDDTAAFAAAVAAVGSNRGVIVIPNGVCKVTTVALTSSIQGVIGQGLYSSVVKSTTNAPVFTVPTVATSAEFYYLEFRDFTIEGDGASANQVGISATGTGRMNVSSVHNVRFQTIRKGLYVATSLNSDYMKFTDNVCQTTYYCVEKAVGGSGWIINDNQISSLAGGSGIYVHGSDAVGDITINSNQIEEGAVGIDLYCDSVCSYGQRNVVNDNKIDGTTTAPIRAFNVQNSTLLGNRVQGSINPVTFTGSTDGNIYDANTNKGIYITGTGSNDHLSIFGRGTYASIRMGTTDEAVNNTNIGISIKDIANNSAIGIGQTQARSVNLTWVYNATVGNAYAQLATFGYSNPITYGASQHQVDNGNWIVNTNLILPLSTPASASAACTTGTVKFDASYAYFCIGTNTWQRVAHATW